MILGYEHQLPNTSKGHCHVYSVPRFKMPSINTGRDIIFFILGLPKLVFTHVMSENFTAALCVASWKKTNK